MKHDMMQFYVKGPLNLIASHTIFASVMYRGGTRGELGGRLGAVAPSSGSCRKVSCLSVKF